MELHWVTPDLAFSGRLQKGDQYDLQRSGVTHIVNLTIRPDPKWAFPTLNAGLPDDGTPKPTEWFGHVLPWVLRAIHSGGKVVVHCESGIHRGPSMVYAVLRAMGRSIEESTLLIRHANPLAKLRYAADAESALLDLGMVHGV